MKKILEESSDGVVVYVAPTKALVTQVTAEIYLRFEDTTKLEEGVSLLGVFTRDIRFNPVSCRVLVTVPQCLEILLLSPTHQNWCNNIKYVVFDEIHSIADRGSGEVWEHLFSLINCSFLALSATIHDTNLRDWLQMKLNQQKRKQTTNNATQADDLKLSFIHYNQRYSDLAYYHYFRTELYEVNPCSLLTVADVRPGFLADMHLQPQHLVDLFDFLHQTKELLSASMQEKLTALHYDNVKEFNNGRRLLKSDVRKWQGELQSFVCSMVDVGHGKLVKDVCIYQGCECLNLTLVKQVFDGLGRKRIIRPHHSDVVMFELLCKLRDQNMLPAIVFSFDRTSCQRLADQVTLEVSRAQQQMPQNEQLLEMTKDVDLSQNLRQCLQRGIGVHHSGMSLEERHLIERLFRMNVIQVVFATSTLAQGINMPCKTIILGRDSIYLNVLTFRQTSGRAGRRGYDKLGNVVFYGVPQAKLTRLIARDLPLITSNFPVSMSLVLRSFILYKDSQDKENAIQKIKRLYSQPLGTAFNVEQVQILFRFAMEYLMEENLLDKDGTPLGLAGLAAHIYWSEPANLLLVSLIQRSIFHRICEDKSIDDKKKQKIILIVLSNIFHPLELHKSVNIHKNARKDANSTVVLESPPDFVIDAIEHHNKALLNVFLNFCKSVLNGKEELPSIELSVSKVRHYFD